MNNKAAMEGRLPIKHYDVIVIGAGAAGLMCAMRAGARNRKVLILEGSNKPGKKILMSGGGYCNFTNYHICPERYISHNPHFCKSALSRYTQWDFIELIKKHKIAYHEKTLGQLFCNTKASAIVNMLLNECHQHQVSINTKTKINSIKKMSNHHYVLQTSIGKLSCQSLVIACGGLSIPSMGASAYGYKIAAQFDIKVWPTRAGLVALTLHTQDKEHFSKISGVSFEAKVSNEKIEFTESCLLTHRGISGPSILQISSYWSAGEYIKIDALPKACVSSMLTTARKAHEKKSVKTLLAHKLPKRLVEKLLPDTLLQTPCYALTPKQIEQIGNGLHHWQLKPNATEGYRTAEVTIGGVDCHAISSKTMEAHAHKGLYFIGEVLDVTGWLGGYNFQWAWSTGFVAGEVV